MRQTEQLSFLCVTPDVRATGEVTLSVRQRPFFGVHSSFSAGDSVLLYVEGDPSTRSDDDWVRGQIVAASSRDCPDPDYARPGYVLTLRLQLPGGPHPDIRSGVTKGSPLRGFGSVTYTLYSSPADNQWYLGQRLAGGTIQPLLGPLIGPGGLTLSYFDSSGMPTDRPTAVAEVEIRVRGRTVAPVRAIGGGSAFVVDSLITRVALRNNARR
jgi:hypothetical protein